MTENIIQDSVRPWAREYTVIGQSLNRKEGFEKVTGQAKYSGDLKLPGMLYGKILRCPFPRARIKRMDTSKAESFPGVQCLLTKENTKGWCTFWYRVPQIAFPECLTYEGQEVAAVAAEDLTTAQRALELIDVEYEILPPMIDAEKTLESEHLPLIADEEYPGSEEYDRKSFVIRRGDLEKGFAEADYVIEETYTTSTQYHGTIQTRAVVASWEDPNLTVWDSTQGVWNSKMVLAHSLGLDLDRVRVIVKFLGGGFGSKASSHRISFYAARLSMMTGRPVRLEQTRGEEFLVHPHRPDCKIYMKMGATKDGRLTAIQEKAIVNVGAAGRANNYLPRQIIWQASNLYDCPNVFLEQIGVYTNLQMTGPTRGPLNMQSNLAVESHMDRMAVKIGMDPLEFRLKNYARTYKTLNSAEKFGQEMNIPYSSKRLDLCMKVATEAIGWGKRKEFKESTPGSKKKGMGLAAFIAEQGTGMQPYSAHADITIEKDGATILHIGVVDIGGGQQTIFSMVAAEELGVGADDITVIAGDTDNTRYGPSCHASRCTAEMVPAVIDAAAEARNNLFTLAGKILEVNAKDLASRNGRIYLKSDPSKSISFKEVCREIDRNSPIRGGGSREPNPESPALATFGAQAAEVEVDTETGQVDILRIAAAQDMGKAINPKFCVSQVYGGIEFGVGFTLLEEGFFDRRTGKMLNNNFDQYRMPTSFDFPETDVYLIEGEDPNLPYSVKGGAEVTNTPTASVIRNAIYNAAGIWLNDLPITPDKVLKALQNKRSSNDDAV